MRKIVKVVNNHFTQCLTYIILCNFVHNIRLYKMFTITNKFGETY